MAVPTPQRVSEEKAKVVALAAETGRDPKDITFMGYAQMSLAQTHEEAVQRYLNRQVGARFRNRDGDELEQWLTRNYIGTPDEVAEKIGELGEAGMTHCIAQHIAADTFSELEEQVQMFAEEVIPQVK